MRTMANLRTSVVSYLGHACVLLCAVAVIGACADRDTVRDRHQTVVENNCIDCHNDAEFAGGLSLDSMDLRAVADNAQVWERVVRKLRAGMMPPSDAQPLDSQSRSALVGWLENEIDAAAALQPNPGRTVAFHRLNRAEYGNVIYDLLGVNVDTSQLLPADDSSYGFDNIGGVLRVSPALLERYLKAADRVSQLAVGIPAQAQRIDYFRVPDDRSQERRAPGMPFGTRGGTRIRYTFPVDGEYEIAPRLQRDLNEQMPLYAEAQQLEVSIDGERVGLFTLPAVPVTEPDAAGSSSGDGAAINQITRRLTLSREERALRNRVDSDWSVRIPVTAGTHDVVVTFPAQTAALDEQTRLPFLRPYPAGVNIPETRTGAYLLSVEISGPFDAAANADSLESRQQIFICEPATQSAAQPSPADVSCARQILQRLARLAFRRPVQTADLDPLLEFFDQAYRQAVSDEQPRAFDAGIALALKRLLVSPEFLYRIELDPKDVTAGAYTISDLHLATRLSFFLWSSIPDDTLLQLAQAGQLNTPAELQRQVKRLLADPRARRFTENFAGQWLFLRNLAATVPVQSIFPDFDDTLRQGLRRETELFFDSIVREDRSVFDLLSADYTFVNERVAGHYGMTRIRGSHFRRVSYPPDMQRRGLLGHGSILAVTSYPDRTSPVVRGKWILENLLGAPPPDPPPDVPGLSDTDGAGAALSMRERLARHRDNPNCASCHALMDPLGFALENFDATGRWRVIGDAGEQIDSAGALPDGTALDGVAGLRRSLLSSELFVTTLTEKLLTYSLGRGVEYYDMPAVRSIIRDAESKNFRFSALIMGVVNSAPFRQRMISEEAAE